MGDYDEPMDEADETDFNESQHCYAKCDDSNAHQPINTEEIIRETAIVDNAMQAKSIVQHLLDEHKTIAVDGWGRNIHCEPPEGKMCLIAIAACNGKCIIFDVYTCPQIMTVGRLKKLLECNSITKVMHNCSLISFSLFTSFGVKLHNVFDTQCAHSMIVSQRTQLGCYCVPLESLSFISNMYGRCLSNPAKHAMKRLYHDDDYFWEARPIVPKIKEYVARDVMCLIPEAYENLRKGIPANLKKSFEEMCESFVINLIDDEVFEREKCQKKIKKYLKCIDILKEKMQRGSSNSEDMDQDGMSSCNGNNNDGTCNAKNLRPKKKSCASSCASRARQCSSSQNQRSNRVCLGSGGLPSRSAKTCNVKGCKTHDCSLQNTSPRTHAKICPISKSPLPTLGSRKRKLSPSCPKDCSCCGKKTCPKFAAKTCAAKTAIKRNPTRCTDKNCSCRNPSPKTRTCKKISCKKIVSSKSIVLACWNEVEDSDSDDDDGGTSPADNCDDRSGNDRCNDDQEEQEEEEECEDQEDSDASVGDCNCNKCKGKVNQYDDETECCDDNEDDGNCEDDDDDDDDDETEQESNEEQCETERDCSAPKRRKRG